MGIHPKTANMQHKSSMGNKNYDTVDLEIGT